MAWFDAAALYYGPANPVVSQGDIVLAATGVVVAGTGEAALAAPAHFDDDRLIALWTAVGASLPESPTLALSASWGLAMVLPHVCALEKEFNERVAALQRTGMTQQEAEDVANDDPALDRYVAVAPILLYDALAEERRPGTRSGQRLGAFPVVANAPLGIPEAWVDLRRISTVERTLVETPYRLAALSDLAVAHLQFALARYWAFRDLSRADELGRGRSGSASRTSSRSTRPKAGCASASSLRTATNSLSKAPPHPNLPKTLRGVAGRRSRSRDVEGWACP